MPTSRREFLSYLSTGSASLLVPFPLSSTAATVRNLAFIPSAGQAGAFWAMVQDGEFIKAIPRTDADPRPTEMISRGIVSRTYSDTRIKYPYVRESYLNGLYGDRKPERRAREKFIRVDWETAINLTTKAILDTQETHGNEGIFSSSYGAWAHGGVFTPNVLQGRFFNLIGGMSVTVGDYSGGAAQVVMPHIIGDMEVYSRQTSWIQIMKNTELFVLVGVDPHKNGRAEGRTTDHAMFPRWEILRDAGVEFLSINPQRTTTDEWLNADWLKIIPNTDTALFLAMSYHLYANNNHNQDFLDKYTVGADKFIAYLMGESDGVVKSPAWAAAITGIDATRIEELADMCNQKRTQIAGSWSIQRAHHGEMPYWAITSFSAMTGQIGLPGGGIGFSWHWGQGGALFAQATAPGGVPQGQNRVKGICPASRIIDMLNNPGGEFTHNGSVHQYPDAQMIYNSGNNFASHQQDTNGLLKAMEKVHTVVVQDPWWTASARFADIVLPATSIVERNEISSGGTHSKDKVYAMRQIIPPVGESKDDFEIFRLLSKQFEVEEAFTGGKTRMELIKDSYAKSTAATVVPFDQFWEEGIARIPIPEEEQDWVRHGDFRTDPDANPLATVSGKIELYCEHIAEMELEDCPPHATWIEPAEFLGNARDGEVHVVSPHPYNRIHSQFAQSDLRDELNIKDREFVRINIQDAKDRGISDGDLVELTNDRGTLIGGARLSSDIMQGVVSIYEGAWLSYDDRGRCNSGSINTITSSRQSSGLSQATTANTCLATLRKAENIEGPNRAYEAPPVEDAVALHMPPVAFGLDRITSAESLLDEMEVGEKLFYDKCTLCHVPKDPGAYTKKEWVGITKSMFINAGTTEQEQQLILEWLNKHAKDA